MSGLILENQVVCSPRCNSRGKINCTHESSISGGQGDDDFRERGYEAQIEYARKSRAVG